MKNIILFCVLSLYSVGTFAQFVENDAELGNESRYKGMCWKLEELSVSDKSSTLIGGKYSFRIDDLEKESLSSSYLKSPWLILAKGDISFQAKLDGKNGGQRSIVVQYIEINSKLSEEKSKVFFRFNFSQPLHKDTKVHDISIPVPKELLNGKNYKIQISFIGVGGDAKIGIDNLKIPGVYHSDPSNRCLPLSVEPDSDGDGVVDSEDEFPNDPHRAYSSYFPGHDYGTLLFEDLWPAMGDYDFNDLVVDYRVKKITDAKNEIVEVIIDLKTRAIGAGFHNGFGIEFTHIVPEKILAVSGTNVNGNTIHQFNANGLEAGTQWMTVIPFDKASNILSHPGGGVIGVNTDPKGPHQEVTEQTVTVTFKKDGVPASGGAVNSKELSFENFNPFLIQNQKRTIEVHLPGKPSTKLADQALFGTIDDGSNAVGGVYYQSRESNLPWALHINQSIPYMIEKQNILSGFKKFEEWVKSNGKEYRDWYLDLPGYRENTKIY